MKEEPSIFDLDLGKIPEQWVDQVSMMRRYTREFADARADQRRAEANLELVKAEVDYDLRLHPEKYEGVKVAEAMFKGLVLMDARVKVAIETEIAAQHHVDVLKGFIDTLRDRRSGLEQTAQMLSYGIFAEPRDNGFDAARKAERQAVFGSGKKRRVEA